MQIALHSAPEGFFKSKPPYSNNELLRLVRKTASLGFKCFEVGPLWSFAQIDPKSLRRVLDRYGIESCVHAGGLYDAEKFVRTGEHEYEKAQKEANRGIELCRELGSGLISLHPPFFMSDKARNRQTMSKARDCFHRLMEDAIKFASQNGIKTALESFCYAPFVFSGLDDFMEFVSSFRSAQLGVLLEVGHLFHMDFNVDKAAHMFGKRLSDVHVHDAALGGDVRKSTHLPIGKGQIDFTNLIRNLHEVNYNGWLTLEINGDEKEILESKRALEYIIESGT
jgi:sugar phosphate isomerase/epimerase